MVTLVGRDRAVLAASLPQQSANEASISCQVNFKQNNALIFDELTYSINSNTIMQSVLTVRESKLREQNIKKFNK